MGRSLAPRRAPAFFSADAVSRVGEQILDVTKRPGSDKLKLPNAVQPHAAALLQAQAVNTEITNASNALRTLSAGQLPPGLTKVADMAAHRGVSPISLEQLTHTVTAAKPLQHTRHAPSWLRDAKAVHGIWQGMRDGRMLQVVSHMADLMKRHVIKTMKKAAEPGLESVFTVAKTSDLTPLPPLAAQARQALASPASMKDAIEISTRKALQAPSYMGFIDSKLLTPKPSVPTWQQIMSRSAEQARSAGTAVNFQFAHLRTR